MSTKLPLILDTNVFIWLGNRNAKFRLQPEEQKLLTSKVKQIIIGCEGIGVPAIVPYELKRREVCKEAHTDTSAKDHTILKNILEKFPEWILDINNLTFGFIGDLNNFLQDHKDNIKYQDKIIIALGLQHFGNTFSVLTSDYNDFIKPFIPKGFVKIDDTIHLVTKEDIIEQGNIIGQRYKSENIYLVTYHFPHVQ